MKIYLLILLLAMGLVSASECCYTDDSGASLIIITLIVVAALMFYLALNGIGTEGTGNILRMLFFFFGFFVLITTFGAMIILLDIIGLPNIQAIITTLHSVFIWVTILLLMFFTIRFLFGIVARGKK